MGLDLSHIKLSAKIINEYDYLALDELKENQLFIQKYKILFHNIVNEDVNKINVMYFTELGYQRKGMNKNFMKTINYITILLM